MMSMKSEIFFYILCGRGDYYTTAREIGYFMINF